MGTLKDVLANIKHLKKYAPREKIELIEGNGYTEKLMVVIRYRIATVSKTDEINQLGFVKITGRYYKRIKDDEIVEIVDTGKDYVIYLVKEVMKDRVKTRVRFPKGFTERDLEEAVKRLGYNERLVARAVNEGRHECETEKRTIDLPAPTYITLRRASNIAKVSISAVIKALLCQ